MRQFLQRDFPRIGPVVRLDVSLFFPRSKREYTWPGRSGVKIPKNS